MTQSTFRSLQIGDTLKFVGNDPTKIVVTNQYLRVIDGKPVSFASINDSELGPMTISENDEFVSMLFPFDFSLPQPDASATFKAIV